MTDFVTAGGVRVTRIAEPFSAVGPRQVCAQVDGRRGGVLSSGMEYPGRYSRWHMAYVDPCAEIVATRQADHRPRAEREGRGAAPVLVAALLRAGSPVTAASRRRAVSRWSIPEPAGPGG